MTYTRSLILSTLIHLLPILLVLIPLSQSNNNSPQRVESTDLAAPESITEVALINLPDKAPGKPKVEHKCDNWYGGIGIVHNGVGTITKVPEGYPASEIGLQVDDFLITDDVRGEVGTPVEVIVRRNGELLRFVVIRAKICYNITDEV